MLFRIWTFRQNISPVTSILSLTCSAVGTRTPRLQQSFSVCRTLMPLYSVIVTTMSFTYCLTCLHPSYNFFISLLDPGLCPSWIMHQSIPSTNIPPGLTPREFFKVVKFPAPGRKFLRNYGPGAKK